MKFLYIAVFMLCMHGCVNETALMNPESRTTIMSQKDVLFLKEILFGDRNSWFINRNTNYLYAELLLNEEVAYDIMHRRGHLKAKIREYQNESTTCFRSISTSNKYPQVYSGDEAVNKLKPHMIARLAILIDHLKSEDNVRRIGALIESDLADVENEHVVPTEIGGIGILHLGRLTYLPIPSVRALNLSSYTMRTTGEQVVTDEKRRETENEGYGLPEYAIFQMQHIFQFHLHAVKRAAGDNSCGPSIGYEFKDGVFTGNLTKDIGAVVHYTKLFGEAHSVVISSYGERSFTTHFLTGERTKDGKIQVLVFTLPLESY